MEKLKQGLPSDERCRSSNVTNRSLTDSDKAGESSHQTNNNLGKRILFHCKVRVFFFFSSHK